MRDLVEIGMGRTAMRGYDLEDVEIVPSRRTRSSKDVSLSWQIDAYRFDIPLVTHPSDAIVSPRSAVRIGQLGGLGVLNAEGLWARHEDADEKLRQVARAAEEGEWCADIKLLQQLHAAPIRLDLLHRAIREIKDSGVTVAARVSPQHAEELTPELISAGIEVLMVQGTIVSAEHVARDGEPLNLKRFIADLDIPVIAGGVTDYRAALHLMRTGAAGVVVGFGGRPQTGPTTTTRVLGIGVPMATAIADAAAARRDYLDETGGRYVHVLSDYGFSCSGDIAKAIACGADAVMLGEPMTETGEAPGHGHYWTNAVAHPNLPRSEIMSSLVRSGVDMETLLFGPAHEPDGNINLFGALRRAMAKTGYSELKEFQKVGLTLRP